MTKAERCQCGTFYGIPISTFLCTKPHTLIFLEVECGGSKGSGKITFDKLQDIYGTDRESVDPRFLSSTGVGLLSFSSFSGLERNSFGLVRSAAA